MTTDPAGVGDLTTLVPWLVRLSRAGVVVDTVPVGRTVTRADGTRDVFGSGDAFRAVAVWTPLGDPSGWSVELQVTLDAGSAPLEAAVDVTVGVPADRDPRWLVPGLFYGENRPARSTARYPRWVAADDNDAGGPGDLFAAADWWFRSDRAATPAVFASGGDLRVALATTEMSELGETGVGFGTVLGDDARREIRLSFPYRESPVVYDGSSTALPRDEPVIRWTPGATVTLRFRAYLAVDTEDSTTAILRDLRGWLAPPTPLRPPIDATETAGLAADGLLRWHWRPSDGVLIETAAFDRCGERADAEPGSVAGDRLAMHVAWLSGVPAAAALLVHGLRTGRDDAVSVGRRVIDIVAANLAPCGTFWDQWTAESGWGKGWTPGPDAVHGRTLAEATLFMTRAAAAADLKGTPNWRHAIASNLAYVAEHEDDGAVPTDWNAVTGEPLSWAGTSGLAWVPALVEAAALLGDGAVERTSPSRAGHGRSLTDVARRIAAHHASDVERGSLCGAPEDVDLGPTSEDGYVAVQAYVALARLAGARADRAARDRWLDLACRAANWTLTFRYAYDVTFPPQSPLGRAGFRTRGADTASPANQHLHSYGLICTGELAELSRMTGDSNYLERARETFTCFRQGIARTDGELGARRGMAPERFYQTRYDGAKGTVGPLSHAWCLGLLLHGAELAIADPELAGDG